MKHLSIVNKQLKLLTAKLNTEMAVQLNPKEGTMTLYLDSPHKVNRIKIIHRLKSVRVESYRDFTLATLTVENI